MSSSDQEFIEDYLREAKNRVWIEGGIEGLKEAEGKHDSEEILSEMDRLIERLDGFENEST